MMRFLDIAYPVVEEPTINNKIITYSIISIIAVVGLIVLVGVAITLKNRK